MFDAPAPFDDQFLREACRPVLDSYPALSFDLWVRSGGHSAHLRHGRRAPKGADSFHRRPYNAGCMQDLLWGALFFNWAREGVVDMDTPIDRYLPELETAGQTVKLCHLFDHTIGYFQPAKSLIPQVFASWDGVVGFINRSRPAFPPGTVLHYSAMEQTLIPTLVHRITGASIYDAIEQLILKPSGVPLRASDFYMKALGHKELAFTFAEFQRLLDFLFATGGFCGRAMTSAVMNDFTPVMRSDLISPTNPQGYGWGLSRFAYGLCGHSGNGGDYAIAIRFDPESDFMALAVTHGPQLLRDKLMYDVCAAFGYCGPAEDHRTLGKRLDLPPQALPGRYISGHGFEARVYVEGDHLHCAMMRENEPAFHLQGRFSEDGLITGKPVWPGARLQFFANPRDGSPAMSYAVTSYATLF